MNGQLFNNGKLIVRKNNISYISFMLTINLYNWYNAEDFILP